jgi:hypothetical protein
MLFELQKALEVVDGQQIMLEAREIKSIDEIALLNRAAAMVDGAYHLISEQLKPGVRQADVVAMATEFLCRNGSDDVEAINAISGERCNPHPHNFTDRMIRPGDQAFFDILQSFMGYRTCYYRTFNVGRATPAQDDAYRGVRAGDPLPRHRRLFGGAHRGGAGGDRQGLPGHQSVSRRRAADREPVLRFRRTTPPGRRARCPRGWSSRFPRARSGTPGSGCRW